MNALLRVLAFFDWVDEGRDDLVLLLIGLTFVGLAFAIMCHTLGVLPGPDGWRLR